MSDDDELHVAGHVSNQLGKPHHVGIIERRVHLIEHANRARVEVEDGEYQRYRCHRLFAARQQMHAGVTFAGWSRHERDARIEQILPSQFKIGVSSAEYFRKQFPQTSVDRLECFLETLPGFPVDLPDSSEKRLESLFQVFVLLIQIDFALRLRFELVDRGQIDRPEPADPPVGAFQRLGPGRLAGILGQAFAGRLERKSGASDFFEPRPARSRALRARR